MMYLRYLLVFFIVLSGCAKDTTNEEYLARVGDRLLTMQDIEPTMDVGLYQQDSSETLQQIVEGWVKDELIAQEAIRQGMRNDVEVQRLLAENERQVLVSAFLNKLIQENIPEPSEEEIEAYFAQNVDQMILRDDYLQVRYFSTSTQEEANQARLQLRDATAEGTIDSVWPQIVERFAQEPDVSLMLSSQYYPRAVLFTSAQLKAIVNSLDINQISAVHEEGNAFHVVQLVDSRPAGTTPELSWIKEELKERLTIDTRKQLIARQVQRLRTEALAQEDLEIRYMNE